MREEIKIPSLNFIHGDRVTDELGCLQDIGEQLQTMNKILTSLCEILDRGVKQ